LTEKRNRAKLYGDDKNYDDVSRGGDKISEDAL
jgi:hypothetical protein